MTEFALSPEISRAPQGAALDRTARRGLRFALASFALALAWSAAVRAPFLGIEGSDDAFYTEVGHLWTKGVLPYVGVFDVRPPGFFALVALTQLAVGPTLLALRLVAVLGDALTALALLALGTRAGSRSLGLYAAILYPILSVCLHGSDGYPPLEAATAWAMVAALSDGPLLRRAIAAGACIGAGFVIKQTAAFDGLVAFAALASSAPNGRKLATLVAAFAAAAAIPLAFLAYFAAHGAAGPLLTDAIFGALARPGSAATGISFAQGVQRFFPMQRAVLALFLASLFGMARAPAVRRADPASLAPWLGAWLAMGWLTVLLQHAMITTYIGPTLAPMLLLAGLAVTSSLPLASRGTDAWRLAALGLVSALLVTSSTAQRLSNRAPNDALDGAAAIVRAAAPTPGDRLLVVNRGVLLNAMLDLDPPTRTVFTGHALCDFSWESGTWMAQELAALPRFIVIANRDKAYGCELKGRWAMVDATLRASYETLGTAQGANESFSVFARRAK